MPRMEAEPEDGRRILTSVLMSVVLPAVGSNEGVNAAFGDRNIEMVEREKASEFLAELAALNR